MRVCRATCDSHFLLPPVYARLSCIGLLVEFFLCFVLSQFFSIIAFHILPLLLLTSSNNPLLLPCFLLTSPPHCAFLSTASFDLASTFSPLSFLYLLSLCFPLSPPPILSSPPLLHLSFFLSALLFSKNVNNPECSPLPSKAH